MTTRRILSTSLLCVLLAQAPTDAVTFKSYYDALPDLDGEAPFAILSSKYSPTLRSVLVDAHREKDCLPDGSIDGVEELCPGLSERAKEVLRSMAPQLASGTFSHLWVPKSNRQEVELVVEYDVQAGDVGDRYAAFFVFTWADGRYQVRSIAWFLEGALHAVRPFRIADQHHLFIRFLSCTECCAWTYMAVVDWRVPATDGRYRFNYAPQTSPHVWQAELEYKLPHMGHSAEGTVQTRVPFEPRALGPHVLQRFDFEEQADEWWSFTCEDGMCRPLVFKGEPPASVMAEWQRAPPL